MVYINKARFLKSMCTINSIKNLYILKAFCVVLLMLTIEIDAIVMFALNTHTSLDIKKKFILIL